MTERPILRMDTSDVFDPREAVEAAYQGMTACVIGPGTYSQLLEVCGSDEAAARWVLALVQQGGKPLGVNYRQPNGDSTTYFVAPPAWPEKRLRGWIRRIQPELTATFGAGEVRRPQREA